MAFEVSTAGMATPFIAAYLGARFGALTITEGAAIIKGITALTGKKGAGAVEILKIVDKGVESPAVVKSVIESAGKLGIKTKDKIGNLLDIIKSDPIIGNNVGAVGDDISGLISKIKYPNLWSEGKYKDSVKNAFKHYKNHGNEFPDIKNAVEYVEKAHEFMKNPPQGTLIKMRSNGERLFYHPESNTFVSQTIEGVPKTMFRPDPRIHKHSTNQEYFDAQ